MTQVILYGIGGADDNYRVLKYFRFYKDATISDIVVNAYMMADYCPSIQRVYAIDNSSELYWDYMKTVKHPSLEKSVVFKTILEDKGLLVYSRKD
jgi:hypothetical protein